MTTLAHTHSEIARDRSAVAERFLSLDVFRGLTVAAMILVNNPGSWSFVYAPLRHAAWNGCTPTDLVFPFFLFAVGNALAFSMSKYQQLGHGKVIQKILTRTALIFAIGIFLNWFPFIRWQDGEYVGRSFENLRIFGVLQRIALAYMGAALIIHFFKPLQIFISAIILLVAYWFILLAFGDLTLEGNAVLKLDLWLLGEAHLYKGYFSTVFNKNIAFDPEGLLFSVTWRVSSLKKRGTRMKCCHTCWCTVRLQYLSDRYGVWYFRSTNLYGQALTFFIQRDWRWSFCP
jgi:predicted acyltransferase